MSAESRFCSCLAVSSSLWTARRFASSPIASSMRPESNPRRDSADTTPSRSSRSSLMSSIVRAWIRAEALHFEDLRPQRMQRVRDRRLVGVPLHVDEEAIFAETLLGGPRLELQQVDVAIAELVED